MRVEVDQSGKIGDTRVPTVLAFSDGESYAIMIPATVKRKCLHKLRQTGEAGTTLYLKLFIIGLYLLLKEHTRDITYVTIDVEYPGHEAKIKEHLLNLLRRAGITASEANFGFQYIGKKSKAHDKALSVFTGATRPDKTISFREIVREF